MTDSANSDPQPDGPGFQPDGPGFQPDGPGFQPDGPGFQPDGPGFQPDAEGTSENRTQPATSSVEASTYRLLQTRLEEAAAELARRAGVLNERRVEAFGASRLDLIATERVRTEDNVTPRDVAAVGDQLVMAYNAVAGVRGEIRPEDVFSVHHLEERDGLVVLNPNAEGLVGSALDDDHFRRDFAELHTYFKDARVQQVYRVGDKLLAVFRTGTGLNDLRVLRWSVGSDGSLSYHDDRGDRDHRFPPHHDVEWIPTTRIDHVGSRHVAIDDRVFVNPLGGTLEITLADGTEDGELLFSERLNHADQSLQDCDIAYAVASDLLLLQVLPYGEQQRRYYVVNLLTRAAVRLDALGTAFRQLPEGQGLIFPEGIYLRTGELRRFDLDPTDMELLDVVRSPNGEDVLYVFHQRLDGRSILLPYNVVRSEVAAPIWCHGYCLFPDGRMIVFREEANPTRIHPVQIWSTPFCADEWYADQDRDAGPLARLGNAELVTGVADAYALARLVADVEPSAEVYGDLLGSAGRLLDGHHWLGADEVGDLATPIHDIRMVAESVIDEFERVQEIRDAARIAVAEATNDLTGVLDAIRLSPPARTEGFIEALAQLRQQLGHLQTVRGQREIDTSQVDELIERAQTAHDDLALAAANYLAQDDAFATYHEQLADLERRAIAVESSIEGDATLAEIDDVAEGMDLVAGTVGDLVVDDVRIRTSVLEQVSGVLALLNRVRAVADGRRTELIESETGAAFATELGLFGQTLATSLARAETAKACDDAMARLLLQLEQLESSAPRTERQLDELAERRDQVTEALSARRQQLVDSQQQQVDRVGSAANRTLERMAERAAALGSIDDVNGFFAADPMVGRLRGLVDQLRDMGELVRADELQARVGSARDAAARTIRDRLELFEGDAVKLGRHRFSVDERRRELTLVPTDDGLDAVLTGTDLRLRLDAAGFDEYREQWDRPLPSETDELYRSSFLAGDLLLAALDGGEDSLSTLAGGTAEETLAVVRSAVDERLDEGYDRGVHDLDAALIIRSIASKVSAAGTLLAPPAERADAQLAWHFGFDDAARARWIERGRASAELDVVGATASGLSAELGQELSLGEVAARYLLSELTTGQPLAFARSAAAGEAIKTLQKQPEVANALDGLGADHQAAQAIAAEYVARLDGDAAVRPEVVAELVAPDLERRTVDAALVATVDGLTGRHAMIDGGQLSLRVDQLLADVARHRAQQMGEHKAFAELRRDALGALRNDLRLADLEPQVPEGFVRNQLIDRLYLPLIGDNLARQIGTVDDSSGARSGLLMLLSPPGYGKTTLVDYIADRLGMALVKVSGPGLGHEVTSLDPAQAPSATAAREVERINLAFALGSNVILYLDDIQHTNPEFLQRFISLCDAQRRVEGVHGGEARTFDLRGKRFAVVMAGNPYTESGQRFQVPDMLANRADTYNLGDVVAGSDELFARSYLENALTSNPVLAPVAGRDRSDVDVFLQAVDGEPVDETRLVHRYSSGEVSEIVAVLRHLRQVQHVVLAVNRQYIASAATDDRYRTEPPFLLQGSYRNMVRLSSRVLAAMTDVEVKALIDEHYLAESQALTGAAEANLLKLAELRGDMSEAQEARWQAILETFQRQQRFGGDDRDPATRVVAAIEEVAQALSHQPRDVANS